MIFAFDPAALGGEHTLARLAQLAAMVEAELGARLPGSRRLSARRKAASEGLTVPEALLAEIEAA